MQGLRNFLWGGRQAEVTEDAPEAGGSGTQREERLPEADDPD